MMSSFVLTLDTTPPKLVITAPKYSVIGVMTEIIIEADEELSEQQEIYMIDALGVRHDLIFLYDKNRFIGKVDFSSFALGVGTIYARLKDAVHNHSETASATIDIKPAAHLFLSTNKIDREIQISKNQRNSQTSMLVRSQYLYTKARYIQSKQLTREIEVKMK